VAQRIASSLRMLFIIEFLYVYKRRIQEFERLAMIA